MTHSARVERTVAAPRARAWRALTTTELAAWYWPPRFATAAEVEARIGGRIRLRSVPMGMAVEGAFHEVQAPQRLAFTWRWDGEAEETGVTVTLDAVAAGTRITVTHDGFPTGDAARDHAQGWADCLDRLPAHFASTVPGPEPDPVPPPG